MTKKALKTFPERLVSWFPAFRFLELGMQETRKKISQNFRVFETGLTRITTKSPMKTA
tara:strand:+ start:430 stop:603 length:174 start_codon:yes stop_codon:yes gene_type:complete